MRLSASRSPSSVLDCSGEQGSRFTSSSTLPDQRSPACLEMSVLEGISVTSLDNRSLYREGHWREGKAHCQGHMMSLAEFGPKHHPACSPSIFAQSPCL